MRHWIPVLAVALALAACATKPNNDKPAPAMTAPSATTETPKPTATASAVVDAAPVVPTAELKLGATGVTMVFDVTKLTVKPGQPVHVVFENKLPGTLPHNWVLLAKAGTEASYAASVVDKAKDDYYADSRRARAHRADEARRDDGTTFTAPTEPGDYPYICSFPGHYVMMKGVVTVKP